ncbi:Cysteine-tryptophan domain-containing zinc finger protein 3 [Cardamine amara subsp. amara]|uniref:Cysteine-tryptophan domain-containing zinc finger protein 3 n=1 Tax=Cardamine amara subsp. amara TaxID=228776 RepID=A0ABD1BCC7_CARAN
MISVSSSDARSELGLGFGGLEEEIMEDSDLEEESTHSYVSCVDPDVALSYIDEKLENVLGHFQKDFEGGVSAENLGAKFGGYGSFLSMYQRSPVCSRPKSPPEVHNQVGVRSNCSASSVLPEVSRAGSTSKAPASDVLDKFKKFVKSSNIVTPDSKQNSVTKSSTSAPSNHKTLKLRIKVGSSDLSSLKNVSTISKQGLSIPPSTSRMNCLSEIEEGLLYGIGDSPTKILMAMVSFPLHQDQLLSPLSDDLIQFGKKEKIMKDAGFGSVNSSDSKSAHDVLGVSDSQKWAGNFSTGKKEKFKDRGKYKRPSNRLDDNHIVSNTEKEADKQSCEELVSKTLKLPILSCVSPSYIHPAKEIGQVSDSYVEGTLRGRKNTDLDAALMGSKPELEDNVVAFPDESVKETESINTRKEVHLTEGETLNSSESKSKREQALSIEHVDYSSVVKCSQSETRSEEQNLNSKLPKAQKSQKSSSSIVAMNSLRGKDAAVNIVTKNVPDKLQEDIGRCEDVYKGFVGDSIKSKKEKQRSSVFKAEKEKLSEVNALEESFNSGKNDEETCNHPLGCEPDSKHLTISSDLNEDRHNTKQSVRWEGENKHSVDGGMENLGIKPEKEQLSGSSKKQKTGKSRFSDVDQPGSSKILDEAYNKTMTTTQASAQKVKEIVKASFHDGHDDRKRKLKENKESGDCLGGREAAVIESSGEKVRKKKRLKGSSCDGKELPFSIESCDRDRGVSQEYGGDSASHLPYTASSPSLCKDLGSEIIKINVNEGKDSLVESVAPATEHHNADSSAGDTLKRCRDGERYSTIDKLGTTKKAAENSKDNNSHITGQATHSRDKETTYDENCSTEKYKPKNLGRYSGESCTEGESQRKNREEGSSAPSKTNNWGTVNEVQDLGTAVEVKTKESRSKRRPARKVSMESNKEDSREYQDPNTKLDNGSHFSSPQKPDIAKSFRGKSNHLEVTAEKLKNRSAPLAGTDQIEVLGHGSEISNTKKQILRNENHNVTHDEGPRNQKQNGSRHKDLVGLSPLKKESASQAVSNSIKEATDLKHMADRLKNGGSKNESTGVYFQAALKFLHGASLLESSGTEHATHTSIARSRDIYGSTAKLCEFCAHEYEKNKDMGAAALAYKCMEVAYLRITYSSHGNISRYRYELQAALQVIPSGESPSLASDGENSNHTFATEKVALSNTVRSSPRVTGNHVISSGNNSSLSQLLAFSQKVSFAMDASRKAQIAFAAAKGKSFDTRYSSDGITSIKRALDFNFQDMEKLLHVVRLAMESINR